MCRKFQSALRISSRFACACALVTTFVTSVSRAATPVPAQPVPPVAAPVSGDESDGKVPRGLEDVSVEQMLGAQLPLDAEFVDSNGNRAPLRTMFDGRRPVILTLNYFTCPMLCHLQLQELVNTLKLVKKAQPGEDFRILTVSFDPLDTPQHAKVKRQAYLDEYGNPKAAEGWQFLVGKRSSVDRLTGSVGFRYRWNDDTKEWAHAACMIICTPEGKVSRYFSLNTDPDVLRLSLVEASNGKTGSLFDQLFLWCYHYDPNANSYAPVAMNIMRLGGVATVLVLGMMLGAFWMAEVRRRRSSSGEKRESETRTTLGESETRSPQLPEAG